jgi:large subunit ribosomal protein L18e
MKSKTKIEKQIQRKQNISLVKTLLALKKTGGEWLKVANFLSLTRKNKIFLNLQTINENSKEGEKILVPGKILSQGEISKKIKVVAFCFSESAKQKLKEAEVDFNTIDEEIKLNPEAKGIKILK